MQLAACQPSQPPEMRGSLYFGAGNYKPRRVSDTLVFAPVGLQIEAIFNEEVTIEQFLGRILQASVDACTIVVE